MIGLEDPHRYRQGSDGAHFVVPFQCDCCWFRNLQGRDPVAGSAKDLMLRTCIRRANLDSIWAREPSTYRSTLTTLRRDYEAAVDLVGMAEPIPPRGPFPLSDPLGMKAAVMVLLASLRPGRRGANIMWETARTSISAHSNAWMSGLDALGASVAAREERKLMITSCPTRSDWAERFQRGCKLRMGDEKKQNYGLSSEQVLAILVEMEKQWADSAGDARRQSRIEDVAVFMLSSFLAGLRGEEVPLLSLEGMLKHWAEAAASRLPHLVLALLGRFKGEEGERWHMLPISEVTRSNFPTRRWMERGLQRRTAAGRSRGWYFQRSNGRQAKLRDYDDDFRGLVKDTCLAQPGTLPPSVDVDEDISLWRSLRRGSTTEVGNRSLAPECIDMNNRWRKRERAKGVAPTLSMRETYTQLQQALPQRLKYSQCL